MKKAIKSEPLDLDNIDVTKLSPKEKEILRQAIIEERDELYRLMEDTRNQDPFQFFVPSSGEISEEQRKFLKKWLKADDIPTKLDSQMDSLLCDAEIILSAGGNQSGKTTRGAIEDYIDVTKELPKSLQGVYPKEKIPKKTPFNVRVTGVDHKTMLNNIIPTYKYWCPRSFLKNGKWEDSYSSEQRVVRLEKKGKVFGTIEFMTNQQDVESFQGPPRDKMVYDEEPRRDIYKENLMRFVTAERLRIRFNMTPTKGITWIKHDIYDRTEDEGGNKIRTFKLPTVLNPKANLDVVEEILKELETYEERKMRLLGEFISISGLVYGNIFNRSIHVIEPFPINYNDHIVYRGGDPHQTTPSYFVEVAVDREQIKYVIGLYSKACDTSEIKSDLAQRVKANGWRLGQTRVDKSCDSTIKALGDRNIFLELFRGDNAIPSLVTSDKYTGVINAGVDLIKQSLKPNEITGKPSLYFFDTPEVWQLVKAMESIEREIGPNEDKTGMRDKVAETRWHQHAALRYAFQGPLHWIPETLPIPEYIEERCI